MFCAVAGDVWNSEVLNLCTLFKLAVVGAGDALHSELTRKLYLHARFLHGTKVNELTLKTMENTNKYTLSFNALYLMLIHFYFFSCSCK
jgi:hypothetical protein